MKKQTSKCYFFKIRDLLVSAWAGSRDVSLSVLRTAKDSHRRPWRRCFIADPRTPSGPSAVLPRIYRGADRPGGQSARGARCAPPLSAHPYYSAYPCMASQPAVEASTAEDQPVSLQTVLSTLQTLTASLGQLANTGQQTQNSVARLESSVTLTANACNALVDKVSALQTQVDVGAASGKKDAPVDPEDLLPYAPHFSPPDPGRTVATGASRCAGRVGPRGGNAFSKRYGVLLFGLATAGAVGLPQKQMRGRCPTIRFATQATGRWAPRSHGPNTLIIPAHPPQLGGSSLVIFDHQRLQHLTDGSRPTAFWFSWHCYLAALRRYRRVHADSNVAAPRSQLLSEILKSEICWFLPGLGVETFLCLSSGQPTHPCRLFPMWFFIQPAALPTFFEQCRCARSRPHSQPHTRLIAIID
eukprot:SAG31_NODE_89_length_26711_cov_24.949459_14_plen_414_part_00